MLPEAPGMQVTASVRLVRRLGGGGMGSVWVAHHELLKMDVAVKFMTPASAGDEESIARFAREAAAAARVKSPHVVPVLDHGALPDGRLFIVMELLEGEDLATCLRRRSRLPLPEVVRIVTDVSRALARGHERGVIHRDVKPANIFLCDVGAPESFVKVLDFGVAKEIANVVNVTASGVAIGTPGYMSPEQLMGSRTVDQRADVWALAVLTYRMLTGAPPFHGESAGALAVAITHGPTPTPTLHEPTLPPSLDVFFAHAFARNIEDRFQSATDIAHALAAAARGEVTFQTRAPAATDATPTATATQAPKLADHATTVSDGPTETSHATGESAPRSQTASVVVVVAPHRARVLLAIGALTVALAGTAFGVLHRARTPQVVEDLRGEASELVSSSSSSSAPPSPADAGAIAPTTAATAAAAAAAAAGSVETIPTASASTPHVSTAIPRPRTSASTRPRFPIE